MMKHEKYIEWLLDLFMRGETTLEQEKELSEYFASSQLVPEEWEPYRQMFEFFDNGMPLDVGSKPRSNISRPLWALIATAAVVTILVMTVPSINRSKMTEKTLGTPAITENPAVTAKKENTSLNDTIVIHTPSTTLLAKKTVKPVNEPKRKAIVQHRLDSAELEREQGEIELARQELMADKLIVEQERQEILDEQYNSRAQAYRAKHAVGNEDPHCIQVVFK